MLNTLVARMCKTNILANICTFKFVKKRILRFTAAFSEFYFVLSGNVLLFKQFRRDLFVII